MFFSLEQSLLLIIALFLDTIIGLARHPSLDPTLAEEERFNTFDIYHIFLRIGSKGRNIGDERLFPIPFGVPASICEKERKSRRVEIRKYRSIDHFIQTPEQYGI